MDSCFKAEPERLCDFPQASAMEFSNLALRMAGNHFLIPDLFHVRVREPRALDLFQRP
jgi:hypothetical protein